MIYYELYQGDFKDGLRVRLENLCYKLEKQIEEERRLVPAWLYNDLVIVARPPVAVHFDDKGYPHCPDAHTPAIEYPDGWMIWADHGKIIKSARSC